jgi:pimeloyl-ACP methyl ester carboxylesterase
MQWLASLLVALAASAAGPARTTDTTFTSAGVRIHYVESGAGAPVVLIHGWSADSQMWDSLRTQLAPKYRVIAMDCRGHGKSGKPHEPGAYGIEMVNDVVRLLDHLGIERANVVGYSMGGSIALKMLETRPERLLSVTSGASQGFRASDDQWDSLVVKKLLARMPLSQAMIESAPPGMPPPSPEQRAMMKQMDAAQDSRALGAQRAGNPGLYVDYKRLAERHVPVLLIVGGNDHPERFDELRKTLPNDTLVVIPGAQHGDAADRPEFADALEVFLAKQRPSRR